MVRVVRLLPDLRVLLTAVVRSLPPLGSMGLLVVLILFVYGMFGWLLFGEEDVGAELSAALFLLASGLVIFRYGPMPRWLAWVSFLFALWLVIPPIGWAGLLLGLPLWTIAVALLLWMRRADEPVAARPPEALS